MQAPRRHRRIIFFRQAGDGDSIGFIVRTDELDAAAIDRRSCIRVAELPRSDDGRIVRVEQRLALGVGIQLVRLGAATIELSGNSAPEFISLALFDDADGVALAGCTIRANWLDRIDDLRTHQDECVQDSLTN